jgi:rhodanese-related sulfurtransferase
MNQNAIKEITVTDLKSKLADNEKFILLDVREQHEWLAGYIPGAVHVSLGMLDQKIDEVIPDKQSPIIAYCGSGYRSVIAADILQKMGYSQVSSLAGGIKAWGQPLIHPN